MMINITDIIQFFAEEAETANSAWRTFMALPTKERVSLLKTIEGVVLTEDDYGKNEEGDQLFKAVCEKNISEIKEGEPLFLHSEGKLSGLDCYIEEYGEDDDMMIAVSRFATASVKDYLGKPLILDKRCVDLRKNVYDKFLVELDQSRLNSPVPFNNVVATQFQRKEVCEAELKKTQREFNLQFTDNQRLAVLNSMSASDYYLIQGPPGSGKSFVLGLIILEEVIWAKHNVIVIGPNHKAVNNALEQLLKYNVVCEAYKLGQSYNRPTLTVERNGVIREISNIQYLNLEKFENSANSWVIGMTPHSLYTSRARGLTCHTLIIDEAGQMPIPIALMGIIKAEKVIFSGDHKQLPPIIQSDKVSSELKQSAFHYLMRPDNSIMLDCSFRMCGKICKFVSELFYDGKLTAHRNNNGDKVVCDNPVLSFDTPIVAKKIYHNGKQTSEEEAKWIVEVVKQYIQLGLSANDIAILAPFRAQSQVVRRRLKLSMRDIDPSLWRLIVADTVDKMQGQEREVIIYSMTAGDADYINEMHDFLFNHNKINVAFSRARSKLIIVGSPQSLNAIPHLSRHALTL